jgi:hypothetical protein
MPPASLMELRRRVGWPRPRSSSTQSELNTIIDIRIVAITKNIVAKFSSISLKYSTFKSARSGASLEWEDKAVEPEKYRD